MNTVNAEQPAVFTLEQLAERWGVHQETVARLIRAGRLKRLPLLRAIRVTAEEVDRFENSDPVPAQATENGADHA